MISHSMPDVMGNCKKQVESAPQTTTYSEKDHMRGQQYKNGNTIQEAMCNYLRGAGTDSFHSGIFKLMHAVRNA